jgi:hypothetical protein
MERSFRTVYIPKKLAGTRDGERRKPPRQVEEEDDDDDDDDDEAGEAAAASAGQEPQAMVRIKLPHAITSAVQTSFQDFFSTLGTLFSISAKILYYERNLAEQRENCSNDEVCSLCTPSRWQRCERRRERMDGASERASEELGDAQWIELGGTRCSHVLHFTVRTNGKSGKSDKVIYYRPPPPSPSFFPFFFSPTPMGPLCCVLTFNQSAHVGICGV